jgi:Ca-activated chloride channel family protein
VGYLLDEIRLRGDSSELRDEVTDLARKYGIVTPYTAYLIIEDESNRDVPVRMRSFQSLERDRTVREEAAKAWGEFKTQRAGDAAVADAQSGLALKSAEAPSLAASSASAGFERRYGKRSAGVPPSSSAVRQIVRSAEQSQYVNGKNFFQNGNVWSDSAIQRQSQARRVKIQFGSSEYFELANSKPQFASWLALGDKVQFLYENTIYEITD